jgi:poly-gamma-glutamate synthesis protein (capsule biosynthesis protein)
MYMDNEISIALTGDSIMMRKISMYEDERTKALYDKIKAAHIAFTNLEIVPNDFLGYPAARTDGAPVWAHSYIIDDLMRLGFNLFSCANNHAGDYGIEGLLATIDELNKRNISYAGIGKNLTEARMPVYHSVSGGTVALIACTSTFFEEQAAGEARPEVQGRPGVNPLRFDVEYEVTVDQMEKLKEIYEALGLDKQRRAFVQQGFAADPTDPRVMHVVDFNLRAAGTLNAAFRAGNSPGVRTKPNPKDMNELIKWTKEAKSRADVVIVSIHSHEQGEEQEEPAPFIKAFARSMIDHGADLIVGHGSHYLKGIEMYKDCPIFYSLGNFIGQNELISKLPNETYDRFKVDRSLTPSEIFHLRSDGGKKGFVADSKYWETVMPVCRFKDGQLTKLELHPISLTHGDMPFKRGRPYLSDPEAGIGIMNKMSGFSRALHTSIRIEPSGEGVVELGQSDR